MQEIKTGTSDPNATKEGKKAIKGIFRGVIKTSQ